MIKLYKEKLRNGKLLQIPYDTDSIKDNCAWCNCDLKDINREKRYELRGNCCAECQAKFKSKTRDIEYEEN